MFLTVACKINDGRRLTIENNSNRNIDSINVISPGVAFSTGSVPAGKSTVKAYTIDADVAGDNVIDAKFYFADTIVHRLFGYHSHSKQIMPEIILTVDKDLAIHER